jgi:hypothetical protein
MITVYLGDVSEYLGQQAIAADPSACLITEKNYKDLRSGTYYTSLGDLPDLLIVGEVLQQADRIVYSPPVKWSDCVFGKSQMQACTEEYLNIFKFRCKVENYTSTLKFDQLLALADTRKTEDPQLWIAGCSVSHGVGVTDDTRYGQLLANQLSCKVSFLTQGGSSIAWAADQILRSDIRPGDTVVWGLTQYPRLVKFKMNKFSHITPQTANSKSTVEYLASDQVLYHSVISVNQVINFCKKTQAKLILASVLDEEIVNYIQDFPNIVMLYGLWGRKSSNLYPDLGSDNAHPGVKTHAFYADQIYQKIQNSVATK